MAIKILTQNGIDNTNIDGARANNFNAGNRSGFVKGAFNEGRIFASTTNTIALDTCELRLSGHQVVITDIMQQTFNNAPPSDLRMSWVAEIKIAADSTPTFRLFVQDSDAPIRQDHLFATENGVGTYQLELCKFTHTTRNSIEDIIRTADIITGGTGAGGDSELVIGQVTTETLAAGLDAEVDIENVVDPQTGIKKTNFNFGIPTGKDGQVLSQEELDKKLDKTECNLQFNQLIEPNFNISSNMGLSFVNNNGIVTITGVKNSNGACWLNDEYFTTTNSNHKYYYSSNITKGSVTWYTRDGRYLYDDRIASFSSVRPYITGYSGKDFTGITYAPIIIDLTEMFGVGKEPTTRVEVQKYIEAGKYYPYREPVNKAELTELASKVATNTDTLNNRILSILNNEDLNNIKGTKYIKFTFINDVNNCINTPHNAKVGSLATWNSGGYQLQFYFLIDGRRYRRYYDPYGIKNWTDWV